MLVTFENRLQNSMRLYIDRDLCTCVLGAIIALLATYGFFQWSVHERHELRITEMKVVNVLPVVCGMFLSVAFVLVGTSFVLLCSKRRYREPGYNQEPPLPEPTDTTPPTPPPSPVPLTTTEWMSLR